MLLYEIAVYIKLGTFVEPFGIFSLPSGSLWRWVCQYQKPVLICIVYYDDNIRSNVHCGPSNYLFTLLAEVSWVSIVPTEVCIQSGYWSAHPAHCAHAATLPLNISNPVLKPSDPHSSPRRDFSQPRPHGIRLAERCPYEVVGHAPQRGDEVRVVGAAHEAPRHLGESA